jgi:Ca-activated chloride channel homolog
MTLPTRKLPAVILSLVAVGLCQQPGNMTSTTSPTVSTPAASGNSTAVVVPSADRPSTDDANVDTLTTSTSSQPATTPPQGTDDPGDTFVFKKQVREVILHATVFDGLRNPVPSLDQAAFSISVAGSPQTITSFRRQDVPVAMGIVIDNSGSMRDKRDEVNRAVLSLIRASNPDDEVFVVNFSQNYYLDQDFTSDVNLLETALHQVSSAGSTALYDAIVASAVHLSNNPRLDKRVLLVITDGEDNMSEETLEEASRRLQESHGVTLYAVGLTGGDLRDSGRSSLRHLADVTGGVAYFPNSIEQVGGITGTIAHDIRSQYLIAFKPQDQTVKPDPNSIHVEAHAASYKDLVVRTRSNSYYPSDPSRGNN